MNFAALGFEYRVLNFMLELARKWMNFSICFGMKINFLGKNCIFEALY